MKKSISTIILTTLLATSPLCAQPSFFDVLFNTMQQHPKATLLCALTGCIVTAKLSYDYGYEKGKVASNSEMFAKVVMHGIR